MKNISMLAVLAITALGCQNISDQNREVSNEILDTIHAANIEVLSSPDYYETAFVTGTTMKAGDAAIQFLGINIGTLKISSGQVVICDPLHIDEYGIPFTKTFPIGEFPVQLSIMSAGDEESIAFARIRFNDEPVIKWEPALREKQAEVAFGGEDNPELYCVDGGVAIFLDKDAVNTIDKDMAANFDGPLFAEMYKHHHIGWRYAMYDVQKLNLAAFTTGLGDGCYRSYIGYDANGKPCRLITDFGLLGSPNK